MQPRSSCEAAGQAGARSCPGFPHSIWLARPTPSADEDKRRACHGRRHLWHVHTLLVTFLVPASARQALRGISRRGEDEGRNAGEPTYQPVLVRKPRLRDFRILFLGGPSAATAVGAGRVKDPVRSISESGEGQQPRPRAWKGWGAKERRERDGIPSRGSRQVEMGRQESVEKETSGERGPGQTALDCLDCLARWLAPVLVLVLVLATRPGNPAHLANLGVPTRVAFFLAPGAHSRRWRLHNVRPRTSKFKS